MIILEIILAALAATSLCLLGLRALGGREPVYKLGAVEPVFFVALKYRGAPGSGEKLAPGVEVRWTVDADFVFVGAGEAYWNRFMILAGGAAEAMPLSLPDNVEDAYVARLALGKPPRLALGTIRFLTAAGIWRKPGGDVSADLGHRKFRAEVMPSVETIRTLLEKPPSYRPAMVNFLKYYPTARYAEPRPGTTAVSGRAAYGRYGIVALQTVYRTGGHLVFYGRIDAVLQDARSGPTLGPWDDIAVMQYAEAKGILTMENVPKYVAALRHRDASLDRSIIIASSAR